MDTDKHRLDACSVRNEAESKLIFDQETYRIIGCAMTVLNELGHGFNEKIYENALCYEFALNKIPFAQQKAFQVFARTSTDKF